MATLRDREIPGFHIPRGMFPPRIRILSPEKREQSTQRLLIMLSRCKNPASGQIYSYPELAQMFHLSIRSVRRILSENGESRQPAPEVRHDQLPENEKAFFLGLALGDNAINRVHWGKDAFIVISTESASTRKRELLKKTAGAWGEIHDHQREVRVYLDDSQFGFMLNPSVFATDLEAKTRFAPFLLGMLLSRLSDHQNRLSLDNEALLRRIYKYFSNHFGFNMGKLRVEQRNPRSRNGNCPMEKTDLPVVIIKDPGQVFSALIGVKSVNTLPFLPDLARLPSE